MKYYPLAFALALLIGCTSSKRTKTFRNATWQNPTISCQIPLNTIEIVADYGTPYEADIVNLQKFCATAHNHFAQSNISVSLAEAIYNWVEQSGFNLNEPMGLPDPDEPNINAPKDYKNKIMLKHKDGNLYEIFFVKIGCGKTYFYGSFSYTSPNSPFNLVPIEVWRAIAPC